MKLDPKQHVYTKGDPDLDAQFDSATAYCKIKPAQTVLFWKSGLRWYQISMDRIQRIYRRIFPRYGRLCAGGRNFNMEYLVLVLQDGNEVQLHIGDDVEPQARQLLEALKELHPEIAYGKVKKVCSENCQE